MNRFKNSTKAQNALLSFGGLRAQSGQKEKPTEARKIEREKEINALKLLHGFPARIQRMVSAKSTLKKSLAQNRVILYLKLEDNSKLAFAEANCKQGN